jgi:hypothetical protein
MIDLRQYMGLRSVKARRKRAGLPMASACSIKRLPATYLGVSGFGPEEATNFDQPATGKTIKQFSLVGER